MLVILGGIGQVLLNWFTRIYNSIRRCYIRITSCRLRLRDIEPVDFPSFLAIGILVVYLMICALIVTFWDYAGGQLTGLSFGDSLYFCFISMSTIGLGDVMPNNIQVV